MYKKIALVIILISFIITGSSILPEKTPGEFKNSLIRLHVLANSDTQRDQYLKHQVKDAIIREFSEEFSQSKNIDMTRQMLISHLDRIETVARNTLQSLNSDYNVEAKYGFFSFPTKYYGNFTLPAGEYEAVKVVIGQGKGANWWCILFPPLCFVETKEGTTNYSKVKTEYPVNSLDEVKPKKIKFSFKILEWLKDSISNIGKLFS